jgi:hypothetical protein
MFPDLDQTPAAPLEHKDSCQSRRSAAVLILPSWKKICIARPSLPAAKFGRVAKSQTEEAKQRAPDTLA